MVIKLLPKYSLQIYAKLFQEFLSNLFLHLWNQGGFVIYFNRTRLLIKRSREGWVAAGNSSSFSLKTEAVFFILITICLILNQQGKKIRCLYRFGTGLCSWDFVRNNSDEYSTQNILSKNLSCNWFSFFLNLDCFSEENNYGKYIISNWRHPIMWIISINFLIVNVTLLIRKLY